MLFLSLTIPEEIGAFETFKPQDGLPPSPGYLRGFIVEDDQALFVRPVAERQTLAVCLSNDWIRTSLVGNDS